MAIVNKIKNTSSFTNQTKRSSTVLNKTKTISLFNTQSKSSSSLDDGVDFLLKEDTFFLLLESGGKIVLNQSQGYKHNKNIVNLVKH